MGKGDWGIVTSHVLLTFEDDKGVATVGLLLLVRLLVCVGVLDDADL